VVRGALHPGATHVSCEGRAQAARWDYGAVRTRRLQRCGTSEGPRPHATRDLRRLFRHAVEKDPRERCYKTLVEDAPVHVHPSSALFERPQLPEWCVYHEVVITTREDCYNILAIEPQWLIEVAPSRSHHSSISSPTNSNTVCKSKRHSSLPPRNPRVGGEKPRCSVLDDRSTLD
jgi:Oligonucleotide/oligosaccharide-binding (OB)-fold